MKELIHLRGILKAIAGTHDLAEFLNAALDYCIQSVACSGGSVFLLNGSTGMIELQRSTTITPHTPMALSPGQGIAGRAFESSRRPYHIVEGAAIQAEFTPFDGSDCDNHRAIVTFPVLYGDLPQGIICLDFLKKDFSGLTGSLNDTERERCARLSAEIEHPSFGCAFRRVREYQTRIDVLEAGKALAGQRRALSTFLTDYLDALSGLPGRAS